MATEKLSPPRYIWNTHPTMLDREARAQGAAWRTVRHACNLSLADIVAATGTPEHDLRALEQGFRAFATPADFQAALSQLWLWGSETGALR